ncbi:glycosyltransferase, partial [Mesorhizobium sp. M4A.F.Ca.ET.029.04.2.1]
VLGSVLLEAMASGLPAVAYAVGGVADVAGNPPALALVRDGQRDDLIARTIELLDENPLRSTLIERGRQRVGDFAVHSAVALNLELYASILSGSGIGSRNRGDVLAFQEDGGSPDGA